MATPDAPPHVLILDGHSKPAASALFALAPACRVDVASISPDAAAFASPRIARRLAQPESVDALRAWLADVDAQAGYTLIVPATEASLGALKSDGLDPLLRTKLVLPDEAAIDVALDKHRTWAIARELGVPVTDAVRVSRLEDAPAAVAFPTVLKPLTSKVRVDGRVQSLTVRLCRDEAERQAAYRALLPHTPVVEQPYFRGRGVGVELLFERGEPRWCFAHERIHEMPITGGGSTYRRSIVPPPALQAASIALLRALRWHGVAMVEFKVAEDGAFRLIEINPRLWGSLPLALAAGVNFPIGLLRLAQGRDPGPQPAYPDGLYARNVGADLQWFAHSCLRRHPLAIKPVGLDDVLGLLRPMRGREHWDLFDWREPRLWWALTARTLGRLGASARGRVAARP